MGVVGVSLGDVRFIVFDLNGTLVVEDYLRHDEVLEGVIGCRQRKKERRLTVEDLREVSSGRRSLSEVIAELYMVDDTEAVARRLFEIQASRITFRGEPSMCSKRCVRSIS